MAGQITVGGKVLASHDNVTDKLSLSGNVDIKPSFSSLDTSASQGPTTDLSNTALPIFACRAWVNFDGTDYTTVGAENHCTIRASGNVSKVVRTNTGQYTIYFDVAMPDGNYVVVIMDRANGYTGGVVNASDLSVTSVPIQYYSGPNSNIDRNICGVAIFR